MCAVLFRVTIHSNQTGSHVCVFAGVLRPQPLKGDGVHSVPSTGHTGADRWEDAQTGCKW